MSDGIFIRAALEKLIWARFRDINFLTDENNAMINITELRSIPPPLPTTLYMSSKVCNLQQKTRPV
jgi:hypothetical protein